MHEPVRDRSHLDLKVLIHFLLEIMCSKHQKIKHLAGNKNPSFKWIKTDMFIKYLLCVWDHTKYYGL